MNRQSREQIIILFVVGTLALNYPLLALFDHRVLLAGIPLLYLYLFVLWLAIIVLMAVITERAGSRNDDRAGD